jgi:hypothetical protein
MSHQQKEWCVWCIILLAMAVVLATTLYWQ